MKPIAILLLSLSLSAPLISGPQVASRPSAAYVEPSQTLIRQTVQVEAHRVAAYNFALGPGSILKIGRAHV